MSFPDLSQLGEISLKNVRGRWYLALDGTLYAVTVEVLGEVKRTKLEEMKNHLTQQSEELSTKAADVDADISALEAEFPDELG